MSRAEDTPPTANYNPKGLYTFGMYYTLLNAGFQSVPTAGTANGVHPVPAGFSRVYVHLPDGFIWTQDGRVLEPLLPARFRRSLPHHVARRWPLHVAVVALRRAAPRHESAITAPAGVSECLKALLIVLTAIPVDVNPPSQPLRFQPTWAE